MQRFIIEELRKWKTFKGALAENYILTALSSQFEVPPYYWTEIPHEVDFIIQNENDIYPVEVKAGENAAAASLKNYLKAYAKDTPLAVRFSLRNFSLDGTILNVPLYMADELSRLIPRVRSML